MTAPQFVDISAFQPTNIDWQAYKAWSSSADGISRVAMRSSYGVGYRDAHFNAYRTGALNANIDQIIFYHYAYPQINNPIDEANSQFAIVGSIRPQDLIVLDFEENTLNATADWAYQWLVQQEINYKKLPRIYASPAYIMEHLQDNRLNKYRLWQAKWTFDPNSRPPSPYPWDSYEMLQYTDSATSIPGIPGTVDADIFLGVEIQPQEEQTLIIDLTNGTVASHFEATPDPQIWHCKDQGHDFLVGHAILDFYCKFGGDALCGLTYLGLPQSNEMGVAGKPGVVKQTFERACVEYDPNKTDDNPPGSGNVYLVHFEQDPRAQDLQSQVSTLQGEIAALKALPIVTNLQQIQTIGQTIKDDVDAIIKLAQVQ